MMRANENKDRRATWEERFRAGMAVGEPEPSLVEMMPLLPRGIALDVAAEMGRNAMALARAGFRVIATDFSVTAMSALATVARAEGLAITTVVSDLEKGFAFQYRRFDVIINVSYLDRAMVPFLIESLKPGGVLLFDTFLIDQAASGHPRNPRFLLKHYELRELLGSLELLRYREGLTVYSGGKQAWRALAVARRA
ncbi:MAG: class I SAM-dependent methyltransferase [Candidatus Binataceae bacterium]